METRSTQAASQIGGEHHLNFRGPLHVTHDGICVRVQTSIS